VPGSLAAGLADVQINVRQRPSLIIEDLAASLRERKDVRFNRLWNYKPLDVLKDWWSSPARTKAVIGSNKSGKTITGVVEAVSIYTGMIPPSLRNLYPHNIPLHRERHVRIIVQDYTKHWPETIRTYLISDEYGYLPREWAANYDPDEHIFYGPDGSWLSIMAIDPRKTTDPNILRGPLVDHTLIDEINTRTVYTESLMRSVTLPDGPQTVTLTFCPQEGRGCWTYKDIYGMGYDLRTDEKLQ
jgi:hypothetical protein